MDATAQGATRKRIDLLDVLRGVALLAMLVYHFTWDLEYFGYLPRGYANEGAWRIFARSIAISFLVLVGISLVLAHSRGIRWRAFGKRLLQIVAGAAAITIATFFATPGSFVYFGILHQIAVGSVIGLAFLRLPYWLTALAAVAIVVVAHLGASEVFDTRWLAWVGFSANPPLSNDIVPLFPWTSPILVGMAFAQMMQRFGGWRRLASLNPSLERLRALRWLGQHSLAFYLIHQPVSFGLVALAAQIAPPDQTVIFHESCLQSCSADRDGGFCARYCGCVQAELTSNGIIKRLLAEAMTETDRAAVQETVSSCSFQAESPQP